MPARILKPSQGVSMSQGKSKIIYTLTGRGAAAGDLCFFADHPHLYRTGGHHGRKGRYFRLGAGDFRIPRVPGRGAAPAQHLGRLGQEDLDPDANIIKLPNISPRWRS